MLVLALEESLRLNETKRQIFVSYSWGTKTWFIWHYRMKSNS